MTALWRFIKWILGFGTKQSTIKDKVPKYNPPSPAPMVTKPPAFDVRNYRQRNGKYYYNDAYGLSLVRDLMIIEMLSRMEVKDAPEGFDEQENEGVPPNYDVNIYPNEERTADGVVDEPTKSPDGIEESADLYDDVLSSSNYNSGGLSSSYDSDGSSSSSDSGESSSSYD